MRRILIAAAFLFSGCGSLNSARQDNRACSDMTRHCGCPGMQGCSLCCSREACICRQITSR